MRDKEEQEQVVPLANVNNIFQLLKYQTLKLEQNSLCQLKLNKLKNTS